MMTTKIRIEGDALASAYAVYIIELSHNGKQYFYIGQTGDSHYITARPCFRRLVGHLENKNRSTQNQIYKFVAYEMLGFEKVEKLIERSVIEVAPLAYMRGRTLNDAFIILDEGQNTTVEQMKMFLTRIGFNSQAVITGDITQVDLPRGVRSGLRHSIEVLKDVNDISFNFFSANDVVRHPVVGRIVMAYEEYEGKQEKERLEKKAQQEAVAKKDENSTK